MRQTAATDGKAAPELLQRIVEGLPDVVFRYRLKPEPRFEYISPSVERITGYKPSDFYNDPELDRKIVHPDDLPRLAKAVADPSASPVRLRWTGRGMEPAWVDVRTVAVRDRAGKVIGFEGTARDVSERMMAQERLREHEDIARALMSAVHDPLLLCDASGIAVECNEAFAKFFGRTREEIVGKPLDDRWPAEIARQRRQQLRRAIRSKRRVRFDESLGKRHYDVTIDPIPGCDGEITRLVVFCRDITRRKRAEMRLRASEERFRILYQDNPSMYFTVDSGGKVLSVNVFGARQLGYEPEELTGLQVLDVFHPEDREGVSEQLRACIANRGETRSWEFRKVTKSGEIMWVKETARATEGPDGSTIVLIVCEDITERRRMEEELQRAREEIESKVEETLEQEENPYDLTFRQLSVLHLVAEGMSDKEIGLRLGISPLTVNTHVSRALRKMGAASRTEAGVRAVREGLIK